MGVGVEPLQLARERKVELEGLFEHGRRFAEAAAVGGISLYSFFELAEKALPLVVVFKKRTEVPSVRLGDLAPLGYPYLVRHCPSSLSIVSAFGPRFDSLRAVARLRNQKAFTAPV